MDENRILPVGELTERLRIHIEGQFSEVWTVGEVSNLRRQSSGHLYFTLKDDVAQISCVMFRREAAQSRVTLRDGMQVTVFGRISLYPPRGSYQLICQLLIDTGAGRLQQRFEELKRKLEAEGLFDKARKQPIPQLPRCIGFVTSPTGAAIRDFISILRRRRWQGRLLVIPARVQGAEAAGEIAEAISLAADVPDLDLLVVGRGGGSLEDLWPFNEEVVVRAIAACPVPTISAVGHEIDFTLSDFAADVRAETPSAAAELISSHYVDCCQRLQRTRQDLERCAVQHLRALKDRLRLTTSRLASVSPRAKLDRATLRLDELSSRLDRALSRQLHQQQMGLARLSARLDTASPESAIRLARQQVKHLELRLENASPEAVLRRGFAMVQTPAGKLVTQRAGLQPGDTIVTRFADGEATSRITGNQAELPF